MFETISSNSVSPLTALPRDTKEQIKILTDWLNEVVHIIISIDNSYSHQQMFQNMSFREYDNDIFIDGDNSMASCFILSKKRITNVYKEFDDICVILDNFTNITFSTFKCKPNLWTRNIMSKNWDMGRMYLYE
jgi:hypothetical protein